MGLCRKLRSTLGSLRSDRRQGSKTAARRCARPSLRVLDLRPRCGLVSSKGAGRSPPYQTQRGELRWRKETVRNLVSKLRSG